ncbi:poly(A) RNA polymerase-like protein [Leptotrombidium deliense]|uniref:Poly(A) RNA polymerase-like protein n=1 Tax=Leptotrombidium deliense TaxID=299467 RepID=A0A443SIX8_9ACAR|nr:poly(A) RNA polymerase-like protein [Leptotrombidium deliense]
MINSMKKDAEKLFMYRCEKSFDKRDCEKYFSELLGVKVKNPVCHEINGVNSYLLECPNFKNIKREFKLKSKYDFRNRVFASKLYSQHVSVQRTGNFNNLDDIFQSSEKKNYSNRDFMDFLLEKYLLSEFGTKLRFFFLNRLEALLCSDRFKEYTVFPFGSSVNGFGSDNSDLDIVLVPRRLNPMWYNEIPSSFEQLKEMGELTDKTWLRDAKRELSTNPSIKNIFRISNARVPIVKFYSSLTDLQCDLSVFDNSVTNGVMMSHILFTLTKINPVIREMCTFLRLWMKCRNLTFDSPGPHVTNFMLLMLIVCFLQQRNPPVLPPIRDLGITPYSNKVPFTTVQYTATLFEQLIPEFFNFLITFNFNKYGFSPLDGCVRERDVDEVLYIENPLHTHLNICRNVRGKQWRIFKIEAQYALSKVTLEGNLMSIFNTKIVVKDILKETENFV